MIIMGWAMEHSYNQDPAKYPNFKTEEDRTAHGLFVFVMIGVSEVLGGQVLGVFRDKTSAKKANLLIIILTGIAVAFLIIFILQKKWNAMIYFMLFFWGF